MKNIAVVGASGGIGAAIVEALSALDETQIIYAFSRRAMSHTSPKVYTGLIDMRDETSILSAAATIGPEPLDAVIVASGVLSTDTITPEKSLNELSAETLKYLFEVNTIGPALVMKNFLPLLPHDARSVFALLSARVGSISDNRLGGWYSYRASKAALNMIIKTASIEARRTRKQAIVLGLHPGTVDSRLSQPFQAGLREGQLFTPSFAADCLLNVISRAKLEQSGLCLAYDGTEIQP